MEQENSVSTEDSFYLDDDFMRMPCEFKIRIHDTNQVYHKEGDANWSPTTLRYFLLKSGIIEEDMIFECFVHSEKINLNSQGQSIKSLYGESKQYQILLVDTNKSGGGPIIPFPFNNLQTQKTRIFSKTAPKWRIISKGLNVEGICNQRGCDANKQKVWCNIGFGEKMSMSEIVYTSKCPLCSQYLQKVVNMGIWMCRVQCKGMMVGETSVKQLDLLSKNESQLVTFQENDSTKGEWKFMTLSVKKL